MEDRRGGEAGRDIWQADCHLFSCSFYRPLLLFFSQFQSCKECHSCREWLIEEEGDQSSSTECYSLTSMMQPSEECVCVGRCVFGMIQLWIQFVCLKKWYWPLSASNTSSLQLKKNSNPWFSRNSKNLTCLFKGFVFFQRIKEAN